MRKSIVLVSAAASLALAACSGASEEPAADDTVAEDEAVEDVSTAADGGPSVGRYEGTLADGSVIDYVANGDGTFVMTDADGVVTTGTWRQDGPNRWCETADGGAEVCRTEVVDENGVYTSTNEADPEDVVTIVRIS